MANGGRVVWSVKTRRIVDVWLDAHAFRSVAVLYTVINLSDATTTTEARQDFSRGCAFAARG